MVEVKDKARKAKKAKKWMKCAWEQEGL